MKIALPCQQQVQMQPSLPFSFERTFYRPSHFPSRLEHYSSEDQCFYIPLNMGDQTYGVKFQREPKGLTVSLFSRAALSAQELEVAIDEIRTRFTLTMDYSSFYSKHRSDRYLREAIRRNRGKHIGSNYSLYHHLIVAIFLQNTTVSRTIQMCGSALERYGRKIAFDGVELSSLWEPSDLQASEDDLRAIKLGYRAKSLKRLTEYFVEHSNILGTLRTLPSEQVARELLNIYGVGKQTVFYLMLGQFHRTDYLKHIPTWERRILSKYLFKKEDTNEAKLIDWFRDRYGKWCGFALSLVFEDVFFQHKKKPLPWLKAWMDYRKGE